MIRAERSIAGRGGRWSGRWSGRCRGRRGRCGLDLGFRLGCRCGGLVLCLWRGSGSRFIGRLVGGRCGWRGRARLFHCWGRGSGGSGSSRSCSVRSRRSHFDINSRGSRRGGHCSWLRRTWSFRRDRNGSGRCFHGRGGSKQFFRVTSLFLGHQHGEHGGQQKECYGQINGELLQHIGCLRAKHLAGHVTTKSSTQTLLAWALHEDEENQK